MSLLRVRIDDIAYNKLNKIREYYNYNSLNEALRNTLNISFSKVLILQRFIQEFNEILSSVLLTGDSYRITEVRKLKHKFNIDVNDYVIKRLELLEKLGISKSVFVSHLIRHVEKEYVEASIEAFINNKPLTELRYKYSLLL